MSDLFCQDVFVEGPREVALEQLVVVDGLGDDPPDKLEVAEMVGVDVTEVVDGIGDSVAGAALEEGVVGVEDLPADDNVPFPQQPASVLALLACNYTRLIIIIIIIINESSIIFQINHHPTFKHDVESVFPLLSRPTVQLSE